MTDPLADVLRQAYRDCFVDGLIVVESTFERMARAAREHIAAEIWTKIESMTPLLPTEEGWAEGMSEAARIARDHFEEEA